ncbi:MAG: transposase [Elusimicrobia bacterium]|nr:transposase [Elusimicrobiota bacterium]
MCRPARICYAGALCHIISRGNNKSELFLDDSDRREYLKLLGDKALEFCLTVHAYVLMTNHVHLLMETSQPNLSEAMCRLNFDYSSYFNKRHGRTGHLFETRFKSRLVQKDRYFLAVLRYIHLNPVKAGLVTNPESYAWSSHRAYLFGGDNIVKSPGNVLSMFSNVLENRLKQYQEFLAEGVPEKEWKILNKARNGVLGSLNFRRMILQNATQKVPGTF